MVIVGADQPALPATLNRIGFDTERLVQQVGLAREAVVVTRRRRAGKAPDQLEIAIDLLLGEEAVEVLARELGLGQDRGRASFPEAFRHLGEAKPEIAAGDAAIARRSALARLLPVEDLDRAPGPRQRVRSPGTGCLSRCPPAHRDDGYAANQARAVGLRGRRPPIARGSLDWSESGPARPR